MHHGSSRSINISDPEYQQKRAIAGEAYRKVHWIFNSREQQWYTPEEFMERKRKLGLDIRNCQVCDPRTGIKSMMAAAPSSRANLTQEGEGRDTSCPDSWLPALKKALKKQTQHPI